MDEKVPLQSIVNFRDVGIATGGSAALPAGRLYRCYDIVAATMEDRKYLHRILGISTLIDLHGPKAGGYEFLGRGKEYRKTMQGSFDRNLDWRKTATNLLDLSKRQIQAIFLALAQQDACPVLIYGPCVGLVLCLILHFLGIPEEKILDEYLLTRQHEAAMLEQVNARRREIGLEEKASLNLEPTYVRHVLEHLETKYQGIDAYLEATGLTAQRLDDVKANLWGRDARFFVRLMDDASQFQEQYPDRIRSFQVLDLNVHEISLYSSAYRANLSNSLSWKDKARGLGWFLVGQMSNLKAVYESAFERETGWLKNIADFLALSKPQIKAVFEALAQEEVCPVLIYGPHTSLIFCLLLSLLGAAEDKISREYLLTEQNSDALLKYDNSNRKEFGLAAKTGYDHPQSFVPDVLDHINAEYRGVDVYLSSIGLTDHQLESVKKNLQGAANGNEKLVDVEEQYVASSFA
ncbi:hypothetical protein KC354_g7578 [Hortaea werneckii]|nr:hypothetical protein KC354_g7578 [Hortaea werneckii]